MFPSNVYILLDSFLCSMRHVSSYLSRSTYNSTSYDCLITGFLGNLLLCESISNFLPSVFLVLLTTRKILQFFPPTAFMPSRGAAAIADLMGSSISLHWGFMRRSTFCFPYHMLAKNCRMQQPVKLFGSACCKISGVHSCFFVANSSLDCLSEIITLRTQKSKRNITNGTWISDPHDWKTL